MLFDPDVIGGEDRAGGEDQSQKREANARQPMLERPATSAVRSASGIAA